MNFENLSNEELAHYSRENTNEDFINYLIENIDKFSPQQIGVIKRNVRQLSPEQAFKLAGIDITSSEFKEAFSECDELTSNLGPKIWLYGVEKIIFEDIIPYGCIKMLIFLIENSYIQPSRIMLKVAILGDHKKAAKYLFEKLFPEVSIDIEDLMNIRIADFNEEIVRIANSQNRQKVLETMKANEEKRAEAIQEYKIREEKSPESSVQKVCSSSSQNSFLTGEELKDDDKIVIFFFEDERVGAQEALKGDCYLVEELEMVYKSYLEESEEPDGSLKVPVCEWQGPPAPYGKNFRPYGRDPTKPVFRLPYSGAWVTGKVIEDILEEASDKNTEFPIVINLMGKKTSIGSYFGVSQLHGQWGGDWSPGTDEKGNTIAMFKRDSLDEREIVYEILDLNKMFTIAVDENNIEKVKLLLNNGGITLQEIDTALHLASSKGYNKVVKLLLDRGADIHSKNEMALRAASLQGHTETVKLLLNRGAKVNSREDISLLLASDSGHIEIVKMLLNRGARSTWALDTAKRRNHHEIVSLLQAHLNSSHS
jgi:hypothetical protein